MPTKGELAQEIDDKLETDINWKQLEKEELEQLNKKIDSGELIKALIKALAKQESEEKVDKAVETAMEELDDYYPGKYIAKALL